MCNTDNINKYTNHTCNTDNAPFFPKPDVVTSSRSGSTVLLNSSDRNAGSPITMLPQGAIFHIVSQTYMLKVQNM